MRRIAFLSLLILSACAPKAQTGEMVKRYPDGSKFEVVNAPAASPNPFTETPMTARNVWDDSNPNNMTVSEMDALRRQLARCWSIQAGAKYDQRVGPVDIRVIVSKDRTVESATVVDQRRYSRDSYFRYAADSAIRALNSKHCKKLDLNPKKYEIWRDMVISFDPREML